MNIDNTYEQIIKEDKKKRKDIYENFIKPPTPSSAQTVWYSEACDPYQQFEKNVKFSNDMERSFTKTFSEIENIANSAAAGSVGLTSDLIYATTWVILTPVAAVGLTAFGVMKLILK